MSNFETKQLNFETSSIKIFHRLVRAFTFITTDNELEADSLIELYKSDQEKIKNNVPNTKIVDVSKIQVKNDFGIKITTLNTNYIFNNYKSNTYNIHLVNSIGEDADTCLLTNEKIPCKFTI